MSRMGKTTPENISAYWRVNGGISGTNGALMELRYIRSLEENLRNLDKLEGLVAELQTLQRDEVLADPALIAEIWQIPEHVGMQWLSKREANGEEWAGRLGDIHSRLKKEVYRLLGTSAAYNRKT